MSTSLVAVFIPILMMGGLGRTDFPRIRRYLEHRNRRLARGFANHNAIHGRAGAEGRSAKRSMAGHSTYSQKVFDKILADLRA